MNEAAAPVVLSGTTKALILGAAALLSLLAVRNGIQREFSALNPERVVAAWSAGGVALANVARMRLVANEGVVDAQALAMARTALRREPLLADPVMIAGLDASANEDLVKARSLMEAARARNPRADIVRFWLLDHYIRSGDYAAGLDEIGPAMRLRNEATTAILTVAAAMVDIDEARPALIRKLAQRPFWRTAFFQVAAPLQERPERIATLLAALPRNPDREQAAMEQRAVLLALNAKGRYALAQDLWRTLLPASYRDRGGIVYDPNFAGWPGVAPFNWLVNDAPGATVRRVRAADLPEATALDIDYGGSAQVMIAEQVTRVEPGAYRLQVKARNRSQGTAGGRIAIDVRCLAGGDRLTTLSLDNLAGAPSLRSTTLQVPAGCDTIRVRIEGQPGETFGASAAQLTALQLVRI